MANLLSSRDSERILFIFQIINFALNFVKAVKVTLQTNSLIQKESMTSLQRCIFSLLRTIGDLFKDNLCEGRGGERTEAGAVSWSIIFRSFAAHGENELRLKHCGNVR